MHIRTLGLAVALLGPLVGHAADQGPRVYGLGNLPCSEYAANQSKYEPSVGTWVQGHLTAMNLNRDPKVGPLKGIEPEAVEKALLDYCRTNPTRRLWLAVATMEKSLEP